MENKMNNLSNQEIDILISSVDHWVNKDQMDGLFGGLLTAMFSDKMSEADKAKQKAKELEEEKKRADAKQLRQETAIMLKAKLLTMKQDNAIRQLNAV